MKEKIFYMKAISDRLPPQLDLRFHLCGTTYPHRSYLINRPQSNVCCIEYVVSGGGEVQVGDKHFSPRAGDTYFLPQNSDQYYFCDRKDPWEKIWVNLSGSFVKALSIQYGVDGVLHFPSLDTSDLLLKIQYYAARPESDHAPEKCTALINDLFFRMSRSISVTEPPKRTPVQAMLAYIEQHETDVIRIEQLAAVCKRSPSQAERLFRSEVGIPPYRYVLNRKMELACRLLVETGMSVRDIASYLSFEDEFYFSGLFRRKMGISPIQYRKRAQNEPN